MDSASENDTKASQSCMSKFRKNFLLPLLFVIAMVAGVSIGMGVREADPSFIGDKRKLMYLKFPGELMMNMLKMVILPLIVSSLITGMSSLPSKAAGKLGLLTVAYYMTTTLIAVIMGLIFVLTIQPGHRGETITVGQDKHTLSDPVDTMLDLVRNAFPANLVEAAFSQLKTDYITEEIYINVTEDGNTTEVLSDEIVDFQLIMTPNMNVLGLVVFSISFGLVLGGMGAKARPLVVFFDVFQQAVIKLVRIIIWYSPIGITFLVASQIAAMEDPAQSFTQLGWYMLTVAVGLFTHGFIILPLLYFMFTRKNPFRLIVDMSPALLLALSTASSSASLPMSLKCLSDRARVHPRVGAFMLPVGATINMDGTALYEAVAALFIAQYNNIDLNPGQIVTVSIVATAAAIGAAGIPEAGLVTMVIALSSVGLPTEDIGLIYAVDWILDRLRTTINVWGDSVGAGVVEVATRADLEAMDREELEDNSLDEKKLPLPEGHVNIAFVDHIEAEDSGVATQF